MNIPHDPIPSDSGNADESHTRCTDAVKSEAKTLETVFYFLENTLNKTCIGHRYIA